MGKQGVRLATLAVVLGVLAALAFACGGGREGLPTSTPVASPSPGPSAVEHSLGDPDAPLTVVEYSDFQCPFCQMVAVGILPQIQREYIDAGQVRFVYRHFPILGEESLGAALAAECAGEQDKFWQYHDVLFANQMGENRGAFAIDRLKTFAHELGLDGAAFDACLDSERYLAKVQADRAEGQAQGVRSTPTIVVGESVIVGAKPWADFKAVIDRELSKTR